MLVELAVSGLGPIDRLSLVLGPGMTALTGETGAGKTLVTEAIALLLGARADPAMVRAGADEAVAEGRFEVDGTELVVRRVVPAAGRSRAYVDGRLASATELAALSAGLVDIHGQHGHQSLLRAAGQREALDHYAAVDLEPLRAVRSELAETRARLDALGGDERARARELELLRFQLDELDAAGLVDADEDGRLREEEDLLAGAEGHREAAHAAFELIGDEQAGDLLARALAELGERPPFRSVAARLESVAAELGDLARELRDQAEAIESDPERLVEVQQRRAKLQELRRKYGATLGEVLDYRDEIAKRFTELESHDEVAGQLQQALTTLAEAEAAAAARVGAARRQAAPGLGAAITARLRELALPRATVAVEVGDDDPGDAVAFTASMNSGAAPLPLAKVASGGELSRTMLALHLVLSQGPPLMIFDEVDAGVGGDAATAVADALAELASEHQVLVVTHLAQVAAAADHQVRLTKHDDGAGVSTAAEPLDGEARVGEVARMLSGSGDSDAGRDHAREVLDQAAARRRRRPR